MDIKRYSHRVMPNRILFGNKKGEFTDTCHNMGEAQNHHAGWKKPDPKECILYVPFTWTLRWGKTNLWWQRILTVVASTVDDGVCNLLGKDMRELSWLITMSYTLREV